MYRFMLQQCQEKNDTEVEKVATIFSYRIEDRNGTSHDVMRFQQCEHQSSEEIVPAMRENSSAQTASKESEQTEECSEDRKKNHVARALVSMRGAKEQRGERHTCRYCAARHCCDLT